MTLFYSRETKTSHTPHLAHYSTQEKQSQVTNHIILTITTIAMKTYMVSHCKLTTRDVDSLYNYVYRDSCSKAHVTYCVHTPCTLAIKCMVYNLCDSLETHSRGRILSIYNVT